MKAILTLNHSHFSLLTVALKQDVQEALSSSLKLCRLQDTSHLDFKEDVLTIEKSEENSVEAMSMQVSSTSSSASSSVASLPSLACGKNNVQRRISYILEG